MNLKQRFQYDLREALRTQDQMRVNVIRMLLAAFEQTQEMMGKQAFELSDGADILPDRHQMLDEQAVQAIILNEVQRRRESLDLLVTGGQHGHAEMEKAEIAILERYLAG